jgi:hypothetical protein
MKYALILLLGFALLIGCGRIDGNDPRGVTGGSSDGYGSFGSGFDGSGYYPILLGAWQQDGQQGDHNIVNFNADGTVKVDFYIGNEQQSALGIYSVSGSQLDVNVSGWITGTRTITIDEHTLTLTGNDATIVLHK